MSKPIWALLLLFALAGSAAGCGDGGDEAGEAISTTAPDFDTTTTSDRAPRTTGTSTDTTLRTTLPPTSTTAPLATIDGDVSTTLDIDGDTVPGTDTDEGGGLPITGLTAGTPLIVIGVPVDTDSLNIREAPGGTIISTADALDTNLTATSRAISIDGGIWWEVDQRLPGEILTGWANARFLAVPGAVVDSLAGDVITPEAIGTYDTFDELIEAALDEIPPMRADQEIEIQGPVAFGGGGGFVVIDLIGLGDDSVLGYRVRLDATFDQEDAEDVPTNWVLRGAEYQLLCSRGVSDRGCL